MSGRVNLENHVPMGTNAFADSPELVNQTQFRAVGKSENPGGGGPGQVVREYNVPKAM